MSHLSPTKPMSLSRCALLMVALALAGCDREQIKVQQVPKESEPSAQIPMMAQAGNPGGMPANPHAGMDMGGGAATQSPVKWTLPSGWKEKAPSQMRVGSFEAGKEGHAADVSIIPLEVADPEKELAYFNMWRETLQLPSAEKVQSEPVTIGSAQGKLYEIADGKTPGRIIVAALDKDGASWYFKMTGEDSVVREQKPAFLEFLKSISFEGAPATAAANPHATMPTTTAEPAPAENATTSSGGATPAGWKEVANPPMLTAQYAISGSGGAEARVNVSMLAAQGGGMLMNINRWRGQLGLSPLSEDEFSKQAQTVDVTGKKGTLIEMSGKDMRTGKNARLVGIIVPEANDTWFYKLMGDEQIVGQQKDAFIKFVQTAKFSNAP
jgi:hypothetical protein